METHKTVMDLWPVIGYALAMVVFIAALIAWDVRQNRKDWERDGWPM